MEDNKKLKKAALKLFNKPAEFVFSVANVNQLPVNSLPEVAFWGRSNVGKSSLINSLLGTKKLVKVSKSPGLTKLLNYFIVSEKIYLVDLPGYGYARASKEQQKNWTNLVSQYLETSSSLRRVFLLIDSSVGLKEIDFSVMDYLDFYGRSYQIVLTKAEKVKKADLITLEEEVNQIATQRPACYQEIIISSSKKILGMDSIKNSILNLIN